MSVVAMISFGRLIKNGQDLLDDVDAVGSRQLTVNSNLVTFRHRKSAASNAEKEFRTTTILKQLYGKKTPAMCGEPVCCLTSYSKYNGA